MARSARFVFRSTAKSSRRNDLSPFPISRAALLAWMRPNHRCAHPGCFEPLRSPGIGHCNVNGLA